jgi:hypothetical protein
MERDMMTRLLRLVLPRGDRDAVLGDLIEERALQANPDRWYRQQVLRSVGSIVWANVRRGVWLKMLLAALAGYAVVVVLVMLGEGWLVGRLWPEAAGSAPTSLLIGTVVMLLGGYLAAWMRPTAPILLAAITVVMGFVSLLTTGDQAPLWYQLALIVIGPASAIAGGKLRRRRA